VADHRTRRAAASRALAARHAALEAIIVVLVATIGVCFGIEMVLARPEMHEDACAG